MTPKPGLTANNGTLKRRLTAIVVADVVGYSQQMAEDEEGTFTRVRALMHGLARQFDTGAPPS